MPDVFITQNDKIEQAIMQAIAKLPCGNIMRGKIVAIKPNDTYADENDTTGVTQPETLRAVINCLKRHRPEHIVVTGGAGAAETEDVFRISGMMDVIEKEGVEFFDHNKGPFTSVSLTYGENEEVKGRQMSVKVNPRVLEYEVLIALNQLKVHASATVTLALKNIAMSYPAADFYGHPRTKRLHKHDIFVDLHAFIAAMAKRFHIDIAITVGHPAMIGTGPLGGQTIETGIVIVSEDALAADVVGARLLGFNLEGVRHLWEAAQLGVGESDTDKMNFPAMSLEEATTSFATSAYGKPLKL